MSPNYDVLAGVYDRIGLSQFAEAMTPRLLSFAQQNEWVGRRILDIGCGTGPSTAFFSNQGLSVTAIDQSAAMMEQTRIRLENQSVSAYMVESDILDLSDISPVDLAIALDVMNDFDGVREVEAIFSKIHSLLSSQRMLIFDLKTIEGLARDGLEGDQTIYKAGDLAVYGQSQFDYERQVLVTDYDCFQLKDGNWERIQGRREQKAFPIQAIATLLRRQKFEIVAVVDEKLQSYELGKSSASRVVFFARNV